MQRLQRNEAPLRVVESKARVPPGVGGEHWVEHVVQFQFQHGSVHCHMLLVALFARHTTRASHSSLPSPLVRKNASKEGARPKNSVTDSRASREPPGARMFLRYDMPVAGFSRPCTTQPLDMNAQPTHLDSGTYLLLEPGVKHVRGVHFTPHV